MKPTDSEKKHGWTEDKLTTYLIERAEAHAKVIDVNSPVRRKHPQVQNHRYNPLRWRG